MTDAESIGGLPPFPEDFLWGVAMSGLQNEGVSPAMDWAAFEAAGHVPETGDRHPDFRSHLEADLDRAASLGCTAFRTSIEWARLEPEPGQIDAAEVAYVHRLLDGLHARGMQPVIALHHFANPAWTLIDHGDGAIGWESPRTVEAFGRHVAFVAREFGDRIPYYLTFNEPSNVLIGGYATAKLPPRRSGPASFWRAFQNVRRAHIEAYETIHSLRPEAQVSISDYNALLLLFGNRGIHYTPGTWLKRMLGTENGPDGRERVRYLDFVALHFYGSHTLKTGTAWPVQPYAHGSRPAAFEQMLEAYHRIFGLPIMVAENGFAYCNEDPHHEGWDRQTYLVAHLAAMQRVMARGVPMMGYLYWTLTDNYEWGSYDPRFGLWSIDLRAGDRTRRETPAVPVLREIIARRGVTADLVRRFPPPTGARP